MRDKIQRIRSMFDSEATNPLKIQDIARADEDPLTEVANMSIQEIREYLPLAQKDLEAIESDLDNLMEQKDTTIILIAAMHAKLDAFTEASRRERDPLGLSWVKGVEHEQTRIVPGRSLGLSSESSRRPAGSE